MKTALLARAACAVVVFSFAHASRAEFRALWNLGADDDSVADFAQENFTPNPPPGNPNGKDDDYYFAGTYAGVGVVAQDEPINDPVDNTASGLLGFERAVTSGDPNNRIYFNLTATEAHPDVDLRLNVDLFAGGWWDANAGASGAGFGVHDVELKFNGNSVNATLDITEDTLVTETFKGSDVSAAEGENMIEITRTGGDSAGDGGSTGWIVFDYISLEVDESAVPCTEPICNFTSDRTTILPGESATLSWLTDSTATVDINGTSVASGSGTMIVTPAGNTSYTLTSVRGGDTEMATVTINVDLLQAFTSDVQEVSLAAPNATLSWQVDSDPNVTVSIAPDVGDVTALTFGGIGSVQVSPTETTTYTITATRPNTPTNDEEMGTVEIVYNTFSQLWQVGEIGGGTEGFSQESFQSNDVSAGLPTLKDDDYFLAGDFGGTIGVVAEDEPWINFERAVANGDPNNRFHFILDPVQAHPASEYRLTLNLIGGGWWDAEAGQSGVGFGTHDVSILMNGEEITSVNSIVQNTLVSEVFTGADVNAEEGENIIEVTRTGGDSKGDGGDAGWIQFDYTTFELDISGVPCTDPICTYTASRTTVQPGELVLLSWLADPSATLTIDNGVGPVDAFTDNGVGNIEVFPTANTTYTLTSNRGGDVDTASVTVNVGLVQTFVSDVPEVTPASPSAVLSWTVDPAVGVTVVLDNGIGDVTGQTVGGSGSITVSPNETTTYALTAMRPNSPAPDEVQAMVTVEYNPYAVLWQIGEDNGTQTEFSQENGETNDVSIGSPLFQDDDYFIAGDYGNPIGVVAEDEPWVNLDRAIASSDPTNRVHFLLDSSQAKPNVEFRLTLDLIGLGWWDADAAGPGAGGGVHDVNVTVNGNEVYNMPGIVQDTLARPVFTGADAELVPGENIIEITRTGGDSAGNGGSSGWIQFDYIRGELFVPAQDTFQITSVSYDDLFNELVITFPSFTGETFDVETSGELENWSIHEPGVEAEEGEEETIYFLSLDGFNGEDVFVRVRRNP